MRLRKAGSIVVQDDTGQRKTLSPTQRLFNLGYAVTSYCSLGKTVDRVLCLYYIATADRKEQHIAYTIWKP